MAEARRIGALGDVPALTLGTAPLGNLNGVVDDAQARATVEAALRAGIRCFDTAPQYGHGLAERRLGDALRNASATGAIVSTKIGRLLRSDPARPVEDPFFVDPLPFHFVLDYSRDGALRSIEDSLQRLGRDRVDIVYIHNIDPGNHTQERTDRLFAEAMNGAYRALADLRAQGVIAAIGVGNNSWRMCQRFARAGDFDVMMLARGYNLLDRSAASFLDEAARRGLAIAAAAPFCSGILAAPEPGAATFNYRPAPAAMLARVERLRALAADHGIPLAAAALQFPKRHPAVASVVVGCRAAAEVRANRAAMDLPIPPAFWAAAQDALEKPDG